MISKMNPEEILSATLYHGALPYVLSFDEIKEIKINKKKDIEGSINDAFYITTFDNKKFRFVFTAKEEVEKLEKILTKVLSSKTITQSGKLLR